MSTRNPVFLCPFRPGVECADKRKKCSRCGWNRAEEIRRKTIISQMIALGQYNGSIKV